MSDIEANRSPTQTEQITKGANCALTSGCILALIYYLTQLIYGATHKDSCDAFITLNEWLIIQGAMGVASVLYCLSLVYCGIFKQIQENEGSLLVAIAKIISNVFMSLYVGWTIVGTILLSQCYHQTPSGIPTFVLASLVIQYFCMTTNYHKTEKNDDENKTWMAKFTSLKKMCIVVQLICSLVLFIVQLIYGSSYADTCSSFMTFSHWLVVSGAVGITISILLLKFLIEFDFTEKDVEVANRKLSEYACLIFPACILTIFHGAWFITGFVLYCNCFYASPAPIHALMTATIVIGFTNMQTAK